MRIAAVLAVAICTAAVAHSAEEQLPSGKRGAQPPALTTVTVGHEERVYKQTPQGELSLHLSLPPGWLATDRRPAIVFFFGGGWKKGSYTQFVPQADYLASRGMVAAAADYRIQSLHGTARDACVEDAKSAVRWMRAHARDLGIDPDRIVAAGGSAGGHLAACTALVDGFDAAGEGTAVSARPNALVLFNPVLHIDHLAAERNTAIDMKLAEAITPNRFIRAGIPPAIMFFGTEDPLRVGAEDYVAKARPLGVRADLWTANGKGHGFFNRSPWLEATARQMDIFLESLGYLAGPPTIAPSATPAVLDQASSPADLAPDMLAILRRNCFECHGPDKQEGGLRFDDGKAALAGGDSGIVIAPGRPGESEIVRRVTLPRTDDEAMPPQGRGLSPREIDAVRHWIASGAAWPAKAPAERHWSYVPPRKPAPPPGAAAPSIDAFVAAAHAREGLAFTPEADRAVLARRVSFDLTGLPPSPAAVAAFVADPSPDAYERFVDGLLASEEFGVRWARMWLDLARYADSHGFQRDDLREVWAYRDWVVDAFNADMPFDRFTIEQVAGDLLPEADEKTRIATGFHRCTPTNVEAGTDPEESRLNQVIDRVNTTGAVWLGTTLECTQCHDHKYDPFKQSDYYRLAAYFNSTEPEADRANPKVPGSIRFLGPALTLSADPLAAERAEITRLLRDARRALDKIRKAATSDPLVAAADTSRQPTTCGGDADEDQPDEETTAARRRRRSKATADEPPEVRRMLAEVQKLQAGLAAVPKAETLVMREVETPRDTFIFKRGVFTDHGDEVAPGTPAILGDTPSGPANRLTLARWLVARDNPLTARVIVNRIWHEIFGEGIVTTVEDFGIKGEPPSHPELLDHLAVDFMDDGWSLKRLIRRIVTSRTYRQDSRLTPDLAARDPGNRWLARGPRFRLDAEAIRDNALEIAGLLSHGKGGPPVRPPQPDGLWRKVGGQQYPYATSPGERKFRRGLYVVLKRGSPYPSFTAFDATARMTCVVKRSRSNTPLQALVLLNDPVYTEAALSFARRTLLERPGASDRDHIEHAFRLAVARPPKPSEAEALLRLLAAQRESLRSRPEQVAELLAAHPDVERPSDLAPEELAAWYAVATTILNLDETITKG